MPARRVPDSETTKVIKLVTPADAAPKRGRPRKLKYPPLPQEIFDGMTPLEREHFDFYIEARKAEHPDLADGDMIGLHMAGLDYINLLRMNAMQMQTGQLVTMSRQHPGVQMRAWEDSLSISRKQRPKAAKENDDVAEFLEAMSRKSS